MRLTYAAGLVLALLGLSLLSPAAAEEQTPAKGAAKGSPSVMANPLPETWLQAMPWRSIGPAAMGGRITSLAVYEKDPTLWWVATAGGGLLKTEDNGITFVHQFDHEAVASIGDVAVAPSDPKIVWVGTGECNPRNSVSWGNGVYKSIDGGKTWKHMGLDRTFQTGAVRIHPTNPDIVYVGALGRLWGPNEERGLYKTIDGGKHWERIWYLDDKTGVIDVQMSPTDPDTLLVATYERRRDGFDSNAPAKKWGPGSGLWKTTDGGLSFRRITDGLPTGNLGRIGLDFSRKDPRHVFMVLESERIGQEPPNAPYMGINGENADVGTRITRVVKDGPAAKSGLKKGDIVLALEGKTVHGYAEFVRQIRQHVAGDEVKLEVVRERKSVFLDLTLGKRPRRQPKKGAQPKPGVKPKDPAAAKKDAKGKRRTVPEKAATPFGAFLGGQIANRQDEQGKRGHEYGGVYRSIDGGDTWTRINSVNPRPMYFSEIRVDPQDEQRLWVLGIRLWKSKDGGKTFTADGIPRGVHVDHHALWIDPRNGRHLILGNDGGLYVSYDRGKHYDHLNQVAIGQFYDVGVGPRRDYRVYGGLQDNGSWGGPNHVAHGSGPTNEDWVRIGGGDGFRVRVDQNDPDRIYFESQNGNVARRHLETSERGFFRPRLPRSSKTRYRWNWYTPFLLSHHNSRIYYTAGNKVFRSLDRGNGLRAISPEITATERGSATALGESPKNPDVLYVGTDDGGFWTTRDGGHTWIDLYAPETPKPPEVVKPRKLRPAASSADGDGASDAKEADAEHPAEKPAAKPGRKPAKQASKEASKKPVGATLARAQPDRRYVSWIETSRHAAGRVYVVFDGHRSDDDRAHVYVSEDQGRHWRSLGAGIPATASTTRVLREDIRNEDVLYLGTERGAYVSIDRGVHWTRMTANLPTVAVHQFAQHTGSGDVVAATHGRSLWVFDATVLRQMTPTARADAVHLFEPPTAIQWRPAPSRGGARTFVGTNPPRGAVLHYALAKKVAAVKLEIREADDRTVIRTLEADPAAGLHRVVWDLRRAPKGRRRYGARVGPGTYRVALTVGGTTYFSDVHVEMDPAHPAKAWMAHEDEAEEQAARKRVEKAARREGHDSGHDE